MNTRQERYGEGFSQVDEHPPRERASQGREVAGQAALPGRTNLQREADVNRDADGEDASQQGLIRWVRRAGAE